MILALCDLERVNERHQIVWNALVCFGSHRLDCLAGLLLDVGTFFWEISDVIGNRFE